MGLPTNPIVVCGSGPSLLTVPFDQLGIPYAAVSTAIKYTPDPAHWLLVDRVNKAHLIEHANRQHRGPGGLIAKKNPALEKIVPAQRMRYFADVTNVTGVQRHKQTPFLGGNPEKLHYCFNRSMLFAVEWLSWRYDCLIFAGCDLQVDPKQDFVTTRKQKSRINSRNHSHRMEFDHWSRFAPIAAEKGILWLNWTPGGPLGRLMEDFDDWRRRNQLDGETAWSSAGLQPTACVEGREAADPRMASVVGKEAVHRPAQDGTEAENEDGG